MIDYTLIDFLSDGINTSDYQFVYSDGLSTTVCSFLAVETTEYVTT